MQPSDLVEVSYRNFLTQLLNQSINQMKLNFTFFLALWLISTICFAQSESLTLTPYEFKSASGEIVQAELGEYLVPENRSKSQDKKLKLSFVRFKSTNPTPGHPIVYLAGGPGGSGINAAKGDRFEMFMALRQYADVIAFDQRGTGLSNAIPACREGAKFELNVPGSEQEYITKMNAAAKECLEFWKEQQIDVAAYNTNENAHDIEELRKVLGAEKITLWGISYGTHLAFAFVKLHPESVDKLVLSSLEGPDQTIKLPSQNQDFLEQLSDRISNDPNAPAGFPSLLSLMETVYANLDKAPVVAKFTDRRSKQEMEVAISKFDVQLVTSFFFLKNPQDSKKLPAIYYKMSQNDYSDVAPMVAMLRQFAGRMDAMSLAMDAMSGVSVKRWKRIQSESETSLLGRTTNFPFPDIANGLGLPDLGSEFRENPKSDLKALFFSGTLDGRTYIADAKELTKGFKNGYHVIVEGAGHDLFESDPQIQEMTLAFLKGESLPSLRISIPIPSFEY